MLDSGVGGNGVGVAGGEVAVSTGVGCKFSDGGGGVSVICTRRVAVAEGTTPSIGTGVGR